MDYFNAPGLDGHSEVTEREGFRSNEASHGDSADPNGEHIYQVRSDHLDMPATLIADGTGLYTEAFAFFLDAHGATYYEKDGATRYDRDETGLVRFDRPIRLIPTDGLFCHAGKLYADGTIHDLNAFSEECLEQLEQEAGHFIRAANKQELELLERVEIFNSLQLALDGLRWIDDLRETVYGQIGRLPAAGTRPLVTVFNNIGRRIKALRRLSGGTDGGYVRPLDYRAGIVAIDELTNDIERLQAMLSPQQGEVEGDEIASAA
jgi:hypothetical protein